MAEEKTYEDLVNEIYDLREELANKKTYATAAKAVEEFAQSAGIDFVATNETTYKDYVSILDQVLEVVNKKINQQMQELSAKLDDAEAWAEEVGQINQGLKRQNEALGSELSNRTKQLKELNDKYDALLAVKYDIMEREKKNSDYSSKVRLNVISQAQSWKQKYVKTLSEYEQIVSENIALKADNESLKKEVANLKNTRAGLIEEKDKNLSEIRTLSLSLDKLKKESKDFAEITNIYGVIADVATKTFQRHGYKVLDYDFDGENSKKNRERGKELYSAIIKATKEDKSAEKRASKKKNEYVVYPEGGYKKIRDEIIKEVEGIIAQYQKIAPEKLEQVYSKLGLDKGQKVGAEVLVDKVIEREQAKPFGKTKGGKVLSIVGPIVAVLLIAGAVFAGTQFADKEIENPPAGGENIPPMEEVVFNGAVIEIPANAMQEHGEDFGIIGTRVQSIESCQIDSNGHVVITTNELDAERQRMVVKYEFNLASTDLADASSFTFADVIDRMPVNASRTEYYIANSATATPKPSTSTSTSTEQVEDTILNEEIGSSDIATDVDSETDIDTNIDVDTETDIEEEQIVEAPADSEATSNAVLINTETVERGGRYKVTITVIVDGLEQKVTGIASSEEEARQSVNRQLEKMGIIIEEEIENYP